MGRFSGLGLLSSVITSNTTTQLGAVGVQNAQNAGLPALEGLLHSITVGTDSTALTISVYDNTAASGTLLAKIAVPANNQPVTLNLDLQARNGLTIVTSGGTTPNVTVSYG